jgi:trimethylguanosine synthase
MKYHCVAVFHMHPNKQQFLVSGLNNEKNYLVIVTSRGSNRKNDGKKYGASSSQWCGGYEGGIRRYGHVGSVPRKVMLVYLENDVCRVEKVEVSSNDASDDDWMDQELEDMAKMGLPSGFGKGCGAMHVVLDEEEMGMQGEKKHVQERRETSGVIASGSIDVAQGGSGKMHIRYVNDDDGDEDVHPMQQQETSSSSSFIERQQGITPSKRKSRRKRHVVHQNVTIHTKYWLQRYSLFSLFDKGIMLDEEGWYSATPEVIAWHHAVNIIRAHGPGCIVVDAFGGVGGNAIQLALAGCHVIVVELSRPRAEIIKNNIYVYGVEDSVDILCGDVIQLAPALLGAQAVLLSPPWGGPEYSKDSIFDVQHMGGAPHLGFDILLDMAFDKMKSSSAIFWLPRNSNKEQLGMHILKSANTPPKYKNECHIELATINGVEKAITVYVGDITTKVIANNK